MPEAVSIHPQVVWLRVTTQSALHSACRSVSWIGRSRTAVGVAIRVHLVRVFALTAFFHRYFSDRSFKPIVPVVAVSDRRQREAPASERRGCSWSEIDIPYYLLVVPSSFGVVWDLKAVLTRVLAMGRAS